MKRPAFQFYPADWRKDAALQACSIAARGVWHELLCVMHECQPYGHLAIEGNPIEPHAAARLIGTTLHEFRKAIKELGDAKVYSTTTSGLIYSRRMVKDEHVRNARSACGKMGGNPVLLNQQLNQRSNLQVEGKDNQFPTPSSSSSSSSKNRVVPSATLEPGIAGQIQTVVKNLSVKTSAPKHMSKQEQVEYAKRNA